MKALAVVPPVLAAIAVVLLLASGPGVRLGMWEFPAGFGMMRWGAYIGLAAAALAVVALFLPRIARGRRLLLGVAIVLGVAAAWVPWQQLQTARALPPIHDISTDTVDPPAFEAVLPLRADAPNPAEYGGPEIAAQQRQAYPDIAPLRLDLPPDQAFERALATARGMGWEIVAADPGRGRIEATATTFWYGFEDDVVVRIAAADGGSVVDVRSVSRVGRSDVGANAARIRDYLSRIGRGT